MEQDPIPTLPQSPLSILFVCSGNSCRSPMAEAIARYMAKELDLEGISFRSAGTSTIHGLPASQGALDAAHRHGLALDGHLSSPLSQELIETADLILTMSLSHLIRVVEMGGEGKSALLGAYAQEGDGRATEPSVPDPFGGDDQVYETAFLTLEAYVRGVLQRLPSQEGDI
jgi:protein-tyrosine-phosphatase